MREESKQKLETVLQKAKDKVLNVSKWVEDLYLVKKLDSDIFTLMHKGKPIMRIIDGEIENIALNAEEDYYSIIHKVFNKVEEGAEVVSDEAEKKVEEVEKKKAGRPKKVNKDVSEPKK